ncbi:MAG TPA: vWA domain-containing protein, partial [Pyrinomonadaceae bacterium]
ATAKSVTRTNTQLDYILLDGSGSMQDKWWDTLAAVEAYVQGTKAANILSRVLVQTFDSNDKDCIQRDVPIAEWKSVLDEPIGAWWSSTPLYDAIRLMGSRLNDIDPPRASIVIVTDGDENCSQFTTLEEAKAVLDWCRAKGWQVTFIGAEFNNWSQASKLGADAATSIGVQTKKLADATAALAKKRARYGLYGEDMHYSDDEKQQFGGYLNPPKGDGK